MEDITAIEVRKIAMLANESLSFEISKYPYLESYLELNTAILDRARNGKNSICFDFIDSEINETETIESINSNYNRIYPHGGVCYALNNTYNYPNYLISRGFKVEIRKANKRHGYISKSYFITW